jgi:hypothetical protein
LNGTAASRTVHRLLLSSAIALSLLIGARVVDADAPTEYQVKAVFVFNFSHFVAWPTGTFNAPVQPLVIGVLGSEPIGPYLEEAVRGELVDAHPLVVRYFHDVADAKGCQILFIDRSESTQLQRILTVLDHRSVLTVSDLDGASQQGVMIQFATENNKIHLRINAASAHAAGLTISSNLMRLAEIVTTRAGG